MRILTLTLISFLTTGTMQAQTATGIVVDQQSSPLENANVVLMDAKDTTFISGTTTNADGKFSLARPKEESFIRITYLGYKTQDLKAKDDMGAITMEEDATMLGGITVKGSRKPYEMGKEGMLTYVTGTPLSKAGTAEDVLKYVPGITKTNDGLNVFGKGTPTIYLNGRQVRDMAELDRLKSEDIKSVELIQNPGSQYAADVRAVVKIRTVRPKGEGFGVGLRSSYWQSENTDLTEQVDLTYYNKGLYAFGSYKFTQLKQHQYSEVEQIVRADTLWKQQNGFNMNTTTRHHILTAGVNYDINDNNSLGFKYIATFAPTSTSNTHTLTTMTADEKTFDTLDTGTKTSDDTEPTHNLNTFYNGEIGGVSIDFNFDYLFNKSMNRQTAIENSLLFPRQVVSESGIRNNMFAAKLVLGHKLLGGTLNVGAEAISNNRHDDYTINGTSAISNSYSQLKETQVAPFIEYQKKLSIGQLNLGVRYEHIAFKYYENDVYSDEQSRTFDNVFPSVSFGTKLGKTMLRLSYSVKTKRPTYRQLSSNVSYLNRFSYQSGNPNLNSEHIHDISLMGVWKFMQFMASYQDNRDAIIYWTDEVPESSSIRVIRYKNLNSLKSLTAMVSLSPKIGMWSPQFTAGMVKQWLDLDTGLGVVKLNKPLFQVSLNNGFSLPWGMTANLDMAYQSTGDYQNIYLYRNTFALDLGITKSFFNNALTLKIEGADLLHLRKDGNHLYSNRMELLQYNSYDTRELEVTLRYNFNVAKKQYKGTGAGNAEKARL